MMKNIKWNKKILLKYLAHQGWLDPRYPTPEAVEKIIPNLLKKLNKPPDPGGLGER